MSNKKKVDTGAHARRNLISGGLAVFDAGLFIQLAGVASLDQAQLLARGGVAVGAVFTSVSHDKPRTVA